MTELKELKDYWFDKYPNITVTLWANQDGDKFYGKMHATSQSADLCASTVGELISQGEAFLRKAK